MLGWWRSSRVLRRRGRRTALRREPVLRTATRIVRVFLRCKTCRWSFTSGIMSTSVCRAWYRWALSLKPVCLKYYLVGSWCRAQMALSSRKLCSRLKEARDVLADSRAIVCLITFSLSYPGCVFCHWTTSGRWSSDGMLNVWPCCRPFDEGHPVLLGRLCGTCHPGSVSDDSSVGCRRVWAHVCPYLGVMEESRDYVPLNIWYCTNRETYQQRLASKRRIEKNEDLGQIWDTLVI